MSPPKQERSPTKDDPSIVLSSEVPSSVTAIKLPNYSPGDDQEAGIQELIEMLAPMADEDLILALEGLLYEDGFSEPVISRISNGIRARAELLNVM